VGYGVIIGWQGWVRRQLLSELDFLGISDSRKECGKNYIVWGPDRLLREGNVEVCNVPSGYAANNVGTCQLKLYQEPIRA
jgi:hypothetical protein